MSRFVHLHIYRSLLLLFITIDSITSTLSLIAILITVTQHILVPACLVLRAVILMSLTYSDLTRVVKESQKTLITPNGVKHYFVVNIEMNHKTRNSFEVLCNFPCVHTLGKTYTCVCCRCRLIGKLHLRSQIASYLALMYSPRAFV